MEEELQTTLDNGVTLWTKPQFILGVEPNELKAGDIISYHKSTRHSEHLRLIIVNIIDMRDRMDEPEIQVETVILYVVSRTDFNVGDKYIFKLSTHMADLNWRMA
jgi:hypothetical protein